MPTGIKNPSGKPSARGSGIKEVKDVLLAIYHDIKHLVPAQVERFKELASKKYIEAKKKLAGEKILILGPPASGKTTLLRVLQNPEVEGKELEPYHGTEAEAVKTFNCRWKLDPGSGSQIEFKLKVRKTNDVGGEEVTRKDRWGTAIKDVGILVYLFDIKQFLEDASYKKRIKDDFDWLLKNSQKPKINFSLMLVANKVDLYCDRLTFAKFEESQKQTLNDFVDELRNSLKPGIRANVKGIALLSLTDELLRHWTLDNLILGFVGENLKSLYMKAAKQKVGDEVSHNCST